MLRPLLVLCLLGSIAAAQELVWRKDAQVSEAIECEAGVPDGWTVVEDRTGFSALGDGMGFVVTREPFFHDPKEYEAVWKLVLEKAGVTARMTSGKEGRYAAWSATWENATTVGNRVLRAVRLYVPDGEMLYNFAFSAPKGTNLDPLVAGVLKGFKCNAEKPKLAFQTGSVGEARMSLHLPEGYAEMPREVRLGQGGGAPYAKMLAGYATPHTAGGITLNSFDSRIQMQLADGSVVSGTDLKALADGSFAAEKAKFAEITDKPRSRSCRLGREKAHCVEAGVRGADGLPKRYYVAVCKFKGYTYVVELIADEREDRLYKNLFRELCGAVEFKD